VLPGCPASPSALARSLLVHWVQIISNQCSTSAARHARHVTPAVILGGWANYPLVRKELTKALIHQALVTKYHAKKVVHITLEARFGEQP
jgi:hypothetical protein